eukprot:scaffold7435_cov129-Amphora_coffeaeformis.AAC.1
MAPTIPEAKIAMHVMESVRVCGFFGRKKEAPAVTVDAVKETCQLERGEDEGNVSISESARVI